jgi:hypothetical protein
MVSLLSLISLRPLIFESAHKRKTTGFSPPVPPRVELTPPPWAVLLLSESKLWHTESILGIIPIKSIGPYLISTAK